MAFDGIVTKKVVQELQDIIGYKVDKIYQPNKNTVIIGLYKSGRNISLLSCINTGNYRISLTKHQYENPVTAPSFCMLLRKHLIGFKIKMISTYNLERVVFIDFENNENPDKPISKRLIIELMGKHSNIILTNENNIIIDSIRHTSIEESAQRDIYPTSRYILPSNKKYNILEINSSDEFYNKIDLLIKKQILKDLRSSKEADISNFDLDKILSSNFNGISYIFTQIIVNNKNDISKENIKKTYIKILKIINSDSVSFKTIYNESNEPVDYVLELINTNKKTFELNYFIDDYYFNKENIEAYKIKKQNVLNIVSGILKKYKKRLENMNKKLLKCDEMDKFRIYGELITSNLYKIENKNTEKVTLENFYDNNKIIEIPLDQRFSPSYNAKQYFKKYSKLKNALEIVNAQKQETLSDINYLESVLYEINNTNTLEELNIINDEITETEIFKQNTYKQKKKKSINFKKGKKISFNPLKYTIDNYTIYVGRNNKENDYLTTKFASKNDIWFHTKDIPGSHVILKTHSNEIVPQEILVQTAKIAAFHSRAKNSSNVPVDYCLVSFVKKPNGSKPGFVIYKNNKTINI